MDPMVRSWLFHSWLQDLEEKHKFSESYAILQGAFYNPEMAKKMLKKDNPDYESTDEDFEKASRMILEEDNKSVFKQKRKKRRLSKKE